MMILSAMVSKSRILPGEENDQVGKKNENYHPSRILFLSKTTPFSIAHSWRVYNLLKAFCLEEFDGESSHIAQPACSGIYF